ncbi:hypothetical protein [Brevundimonas sp.]|uniref:hypothetical protein n=1 Tax=Brevundimonas sp. TaxID=1871086 RepID=UPI00289641DC|nr:hypothetical protein [Brevundimonas sp.]
MNVPTPYMVEQCRKLLQPLAGNDWPKVARQAFTLMTAAAPKAEPVSDPYKLEWRPIDDRAPVGVPVFVYWPRMALDDDGEPTGEVLEDDGHITLTLRHSLSAGWEPDNIVEANGAYFDDDFEFGEPTHWAPRPPRPQPLSNPQQLPEAPKAEPVGDPDELALALQDAKDAVAFFDKVRAATQDEQIAVGTDHHNWLQSAIRRLAACDYTHPAPASDELPTSIRDIGAERQRQVKVEGWSHERDDGYVDGDLAIAGACYALLGSRKWAIDALRRGVWPKGWSARWLKSEPNNPRRDLVKAGALIAAEIERLDRLAKHKGPQS